MSGLNEPRRDTYSLTTRELRRRAMTPAQAPEDERLGSAPLDELLRRVIDPRTIYGPDDRVDLYQVTDQAILARAKGVAVVVDESRLAKQSDGTFRLTAPTAAELLQGSYHVPPCSGERFMAQPVPGECTAFFVTPTCVATAGHCLEPPTELSRLRFVTGFQMVNATTPVTMIPATQVFEPQALIRTRPGVEDGPDYALIRVTNAAGAKGSPLAVLNGRFPSNIGVYIIGHPLGMPMKYAPNSVLRDNTHPHSFVANLDVFGGNSGSPVFEQTSGLVVGILVRGGTDFEVQNGCFMSKVCPDTGCGGEVVQRINEVFGRIDELAITLTIGDNGIWSNREAYLRLSRTASFAYKLDIGNPDPHQVIRVELNAAQLGVPTIDSIDMVEISSPPTGGALFWDSWSLRGVSLSINSYDGYYSWPAINHVFEDTGSSPNDPTEVWRALLSHC